MFNILEGRFILRFVEEVRGVWEHMLENNTQGVPEKDLLVDDLAGKKQCDF